MKYMIVASLAAALGFFGYTQDAQENPMQSKPHEAHGWLKHLVGSWDAEMKAAMAPGEEPLTWKGEQKGYMLGEFWLIVEGGGDMPGGGKMKSIMTLGYDTKRNKYHGTWIDSVNNHLWHYLGSVDEAKKVLTLEADGPAFDGTDKMMKYRDIIELKDKDSYTLSSQVQGADGSWSTFMTAQMKRRT